VVILREHRLGAAQRQLEVDREEGGHHADGQQGRDFSPWSWTPLLFGAGAMIFVLGLAIDWWIVGLAFLSSLHPDMRRAPPLLSGNGGALDRRSRRSVGVLSAAVLEDHP
jgi:hypothetical protein